jgi:hypothetical protein
MKRRIFADLFEVDGPETGLNEVLTIPLKETNSSFAWGRNLQRSKMLEGPCGKSLRGSRQPSAELFSADFMWAKF